MARFNAPAYYSVGSAPWNVVVGDINKDGFLDLAVASDGSGSVSILQGNGDGTFKPAIFVPTGASQVGSVALGDFNGDGFLGPGDDQRARITLFMSCSTKSYRDPQLRGGQRSTAMNSGPYYLTIGDFNRDGNTDIISANNGNTTVGCCSATARALWSSDLLYRGRRRHLRQRRRYQWRRPG